MAAPGRTAPVLRPRWRRIQSRWLDGGPETILALRIRDLARTAAVARSAFDEPSVRPPQQDDPDDLVGRAVDDPDLRGDQR
jgi:hypothetical protein